MVSQREQQLRRDEQRCHALPTQPQATTTAIATCAVSIAVVILLLPLPLAASALERCPERGSLVMLAPIEDEGLGCAQQCAACELFLVTHVAGGYFWQAERGACSIRC